MLILVISLLKLNDCVLAEFLRKGPPFPSAGYDDLEASHILPRTDHYRITPSPGGLGDRYGKCSPSIQYNK